MTFQAPHALVPCASSRHSEVMPGWSPLPAAASLMMSRICKFQSTDLLAITSRYAHGVASAAQQDEPVRVLLSCHGN